MVTDRVGDLIIRLKNAGAIGNRSVALPYSKHLESIAKKLQQLGFVSDVSSSGNGKRTLDITLAYDERGVHRISDVKRVSKPGRRLYASAKEAHGVKNGLGASILSTPKGILSDKEARKARVGGETLFHVW